MATTGFKGVGWFMALVVVAPGCYLVTSQVAAERARVHSVDRSIIQARRDIRDLETEFNTRANMAQLERWNGDLLALSAPRADQFLPAGAAGVAQLDSGRLENAPQLAALVVPRAPVFSDGPAPAEIQASAGLETAASKVTDKAALAQAASDAQESGTKANATQRSVTDRSVIAAAATRGTGGKSTKSPKVEAMAMLDRQLLSDARLQTLVQDARKDAARR